MLLIHALVDSADSFFFNGGNSVGRYFVARGFDVWVGNNRGNKYCQGIAGRGGGDGQGDGKIFLRLASAGFGGGKFGFGFGVNRSFSRIGRILDRLLLIFPIENLA